MDSWLKPTVERGMQYLFSLGLDATPGDFELTVDHWVNGLEQQTVVVLTQTQLEQAFNRLYKECQQFPTFNTLLRMFPPQQWFTDAIATGLQRLLVLSLTRAPAAENITITRDVWAETLWESGCLWEQTLDEHRIDQAFKALCRQSKDWPRPVELIAVIGKRTPLPALPPPVMPKEQVMENRAKMIATIKGLCANNTVTPGKKRRRA